MPALGGTRGGPKKFGHRRDPPPGKKPVAEIWLNLCFEKPKKLLENGFQRRWRQVLKPKTTINVLYC